MSVRVAIIGATGYTAVEAIKLLLRHPRAEVTAVTSRQDEGQSIAAVHPALAGRLSLPLEPVDPQRLADVADVAFSCLPHGASAETVYRLREAGLRVIDFSADFRLGAVDLYEQWYGVRHPWPEMVGRVPYGLPELFGSELAEAPLIANPGCYPSAALLPLAPLLAAGAIEPHDIIVDAKSGLTGAGRSVKLKTLFAEANESITAYSVGAHRHQPEMTDLLQRASGAACDVLFTPHLTPMDRGILATIYVRPKAIDARAVMDVWRETYDRQPFVRIIDHLPATKFVSGTNFCDMTVRQIGERLVLISAIDNLIKGASGAAVQNLNCSYGWDPALGLLP